VARLGEHIAELQNPFAKLTPVRASSNSFGINSRNQPACSGQWRGRRCWSVISSRMFGFRAKTPDRFRSGVSAAAD
jgi:hypothetical protein